LTVGALTGEWGGLFGGFIITADHVVERKDISVVLADGSRILRRCRKRSRQ
jgi:hypothetical protein